MNRHCRLVLGLLCVASSALAEPMRPATLAEVIDAHGGRNALLAIEGYAARLDVTGRWVRQSPAAGPPWNTSEVVRCHSMDLAAGGYAGYERGMAPGFHPVHAARWLVAGQEGAAAQGWEFNVLEGWRESRSTEDLGEHLQRARLGAPTLLVRAMAAESERVTALPAETAAGGSRSLFRFRPTGGRALRLAFDTRTRMLRELTVAETTMRFDGYEMVDGFPVSRRMSVDHGADTVRRMHLAGAIFDGEFPGVPESLRDLPEADPETGAHDRDFRTHTPAPGLHLVGEGYRYQSFVEFSDFLVALGGVDGVRKRLEAIRSVTGAKPLRYALITHHHAEHLAGVPELVEAGAVLVISPAHESAVRAAAGPGREPRLAHVEDRNEITDGERTLLFLDLGPTRHATHLLGAWLPADKLLFTADLATHPGGRSARVATPGVQDLYDAIERLELDATRFAGTHSPRVRNLADLKAALNRTANMTKSAEAAMAVCPP